MNDADKKRILANLKAKGYEPPKKRKKKADEGTVAEQPVAESHD